MNQLEEIESLLGKNSYNFSSKVINAAADLLAEEYYAHFLDKEVLSANIAESLSKRCKTIVDSYISSLLHKGYDIMRYQSNGAVILGKIFMSKSNLHKFLDEYDIKNPTQDNYFRRAKIHLIEDDNYKNVIFVGNSKFENIGLNKRVIVGTIV